MPLHWIRSITATEGEYRYDFKTDVWVFGDRRGYAALISDLQRAAAATKPIHVAAVPIDSPGMRCAILPACKLPTRRAVFRAVERVVFFRRTKTMQIVLCGNKRAYAKLADLARRAIKAAGDPYDHWHVDDDTDAWVVQRSIALNLRGAVKGWSDKALEPYAEFIRTGGQRRLPDDMGWLTPQPENAYDCFPPDMGDVLLGLSPGVACAMD